MTRLFLVLALATAALGACSSAPRPVGGATPTESTAASRSPGATGSPSPAGSPTESASATTAPPEALDGCTAHDLTVTVATDRKTYTSTQDVKLTLTAKNRSPYACTTSGNSCMDGVNVTDSNGNVVWRSTPIGVACPAPKRHVVAPGAAQSYSYTWKRSCSDPHGCPSAQYVSTGPHTANGHWRLSDGSELTAAAATFTISR